MTLVREFRTDGGEASEQGYRSGRVLLADHLQKSRSAQRLGVVCFQYGNAAAIEPSDSGCSGRVRAVGPLPGVGDTDVRQGAETVTALVQAGQTASRR